MTARRTMCGQYRGAGKATDFDTTANALHRLDERV